MTGAGRTRLALAAAAVIALAACARDNVAVLQPPPPAAPATTAPRPAAVMPAAPAPVASAAAAASVRQPAAQSPAELLPKQRFIALVSERLQHDPAFLGVTGTNYFCLRSLIDRATGAAVHQLYVSDSYEGDERFYDSARDEGGQALKFLSIGRHKITCDHGCAYIEDFAADIPEAMLRAHSQGLAVVFGARNGTAQRIDVPGPLIAHQLAEFDALRRKLGPVATR